MSKLWDYMQSEHGVTLLSSDEAEIIQCVKIYFVENLKTDIKSLIDESQFESGQAQMAYNNALQTVLELIEYYENDKHLKQ